MTRSQIFVRLGNLLLTAGVPPSLIAEEVSFGHEGLFFDSYAKERLALGIDQTFGLQLSRADIAECRTIGDLVDLIFDILSGRR